MKGERNMAKDNSLRDLRDYVHKHTRKEIKNKYVTEPEKLKQAYEIKSLQEEDAYRKKMGMWN